MGTRGEAGEDTLLGCKEPRGTDRLFVRDLDEIGDKLSIEQGKVDPGVAWPLELVAGVRNGLASEDGRARWLNKVSAQHRFPSSQGSRDACVRATCARQ